MTTQFIKRLTECITLNNIVHNLKQIISEQYAEAKEETVDLVIATILRIPFQIVT